MPRTGGEVVVGATVEERADLVVTAGAVRELLRTATDVLPEIAEYELVEARAGLRPLVGRSCHDATELARLSAEDFVAVSPVFASRSKPGYGPPLQATGLARLVRRTRVQVLALGGVTSPDQVAVCVSAGAAGVAVMGAVMRADDPAALVRALGADQRRGPGVEWHTGSGRWTR